MPGTAESSSQFCAELRRAPSSVPNDRRTGVRHREEFLQACAETHPPATPTEGASLGVGVAARDDDPRRLEVHRAHAVPDHRQREAGVELEDVVRETGRDIDDPP